MKKKNKKKLKKSVDIPILILYKGIESDKEPKPKEIQNG